MDQNSKDGVTRAVQGFYDEMPFNYRNSAQDGADYIAGHNQIKDGYPNAELILSGLKNGKSLDVGCGAGWFSNTLAYYYDMRVIGIDLSGKAIERAMEVGRELKLSNVEFRCGDLFEARFEDRFGFVNSLGVLHHTYDCKKAIEAITAHVEDGGYLHIGLYHKYGREPFLNLFKKYRDKIRGNIALSKTEFKEAFGIYRELNRNVKDDTFLLSWFRDQVLHPHETQHTLKEINSWLAESGFSIESTSINRFEKIPDLNLLFEEENKYYEFSVERNVNQKRYFPGFFTVLARRHTSAGASKPERPC